MLGSRLQYIINEIHVEPFASFPELKSLKAPKCHIWIQNLGIYEGIKEGPLRIKA